MPWPAGVCTPDRYPQRDRRKVAHLAGFICPHCPHLKTVFPQSKWGQNSSMVTGTYAGFSGLSPLSPRKKNNPPKETGASGPHPAPWCPHFRGHSACLVATCAPTPGVGSFRAVRCAGHSRPEAALVCSAGKGCTVNGGRWTTIGRRYGETAPAAPPVLGPSRPELVRVIRCAMADCFTGCPKGVNLTPARPA
jgi:hypothetical protein